MRRLNKMRRSGFYWIVIVGLSLALDAKATLTESTEEFHDSDDVPHTSEESETSPMFQAQQDDEPMSIEKLVSFQRVYVNNVMVLLNGMDDTPEEPVEDFSESGNESVEDAEESAVQEKDDVIWVNDYGTNEKSRLSIHPLDHLQYECEIPNDILESLEYKWRVNGIFVDEKEPSFSPDLKEFSLSDEAERVNLHVSCSFKLNRYEKPIELQFPTVHLDNYKFQNWRPNIYFFKRKYKRSLAVLRVLFVTFGAVGFVFLVGFGIYKKCRSKKHETTKQEETNQPFLKIIS